MSATTAADALAALVWCGGTVPRVVADAVLRELGSETRTHHLAELDGALVDDDLVIITGPALRVGSRHLLDQSQAWRETCLRHLLPAVADVVTSATQSSVRLAAAVAGIRAFELLGVSHEDAGTLGGWALTAAEILRQDGQHEAAEAVLLDATAALLAGR